MQNTSGAGTLAEALRVPEQKQLQLQRRSITSQVHKDEALSCFLVVILRILRAPVA